MSNSKHAKHDQNQAIFYEQALLISKHFASPSQLTVNEFDEFIKSTLPIQKTKVGMLYAKAPKVHSAAMRCEVMKRCRTTMADPKFNAIYPSIDRKSIEVIKPDEMYEVRSFADNVVIKAKFCPERVIRFIDGQTKVAQRQAELANWDSEEQRESAMRFLEKMNLMAAMINDTSKQVQNMLNQLGQ